jgi:hypothetical protein
MTGIQRQVDEVLQGDPSARSWWLVVACGLVYGAVMGSFGGRFGQAFVSAVKVPLLLMTTVVLSLPSFFVLNTLLGLRNDFGIVVRALIASQAGLTIILASLAPLTLFWYASSSDYQAAVLCNAGMFAVSSVGSQWLLHRAYRPLIAQNAKHRWLLRTWLALYAFVGIQMGWILRPFIGVAGQPVQFFRADLWDNAYVIVARMIWDFISGRG